MDAEQPKENIRRTVDDFLQNRAEMIRLIDEIAKELDEVHKNVKITKVVTGSTGIAGTILCLTGLVLAIPTAGLSMFLTIGGGALAALSGTAHLDEANVLKLNECLEEENEQLQNSVGEHTLRETTSSIVGEIASLSNLTCSIIRVSQAATLTVNTIKMIGVASTVLSVATLPVQIIDLAANGHALGTNQASETSIKLRQLAESLNSQVGNIKIYMEQQQL